MADVVIEDSRIPMLEKIVARNRANGKIVKVIFPNRMQIGLTNAAGSFTGGVTIYGDLEVKGTFDAAAGGISEADVLEILSNNNYVNQAYLTTYGYITQATLSSQLGSYASIAFLTANNYITLSYLQSNKYIAIKEPTETTVSNVAAGATGTATISMFQSGTIDFLQLTSSANSTNCDIEIYGDASYTRSTLNYKAVGINMSSPGTSYVDRVPFVYFTGEGDTNLYCKIYNNGITAQTYKVRVIGKGMV